MKHHQQLPWTAFGGEDGNREFYPLAVWQSKADIFDLTGRWQEAEDIQRRHIKYAVLYGNSQLEARAGNSLGWLLHRGGRDEEAAGLFERSRQIFFDSGDLRGLAKTLGFIGGVNYHQGRYAQALDYYHQQLRTSEQTGDRAGICVAYNNLGNVVGEQGELDRSHQYYQRSLALAEEIGDILRQATIIGNIGVIHWSKGDYVRAAEWFGRQMKLAERVGDKYSISSTIANLASLCLLQGQVDQAERHLEHKIKLAREMDDIRGLSIALDNQALVCKYRNDFARAEELYLEAIALGERCQARYYLCGYMYNLALLYCELSRFRESAEYNRRAGEMAGEIGDAGTLADSRILKLRIQAVRDRDGASKGLRRMLEEGADLPHRAEALYRLYQLEGRTEDRREALEIYRGLYARSPDHQHRQKIQELESAATAIR